MDKIKVLIADDDPAICESMSMMLQDAGYTVMTTSDSETIHIVHTYHPDIILLDIWMSGVDGSDICQQLKRQKRTKAIPIILVSANRDIKQVAKRAGADGFIVKPFEMDDLLRQVAHYAYQSSTL